MSRTHINLCLIGGVLAFTQGCVSQTNLTKNGHLMLENRNPGKVKIHCSHAYESDGHLIVRGLLKRQDHAAMPIPAHVHVLALSDDNRISQSLYTKELFVPRNKVGKGIDWRRFQVRSSTIPPVGSRLLITVHNHNESHTDQDLLRPDF